MQGKMNLNKRLASLLGGALALGAASLVSSGAMAGMKPTNMVDSEGCEYAGAGYASPAINYCGKAKSSWTASIIHNAVGSFSSAGRNGSSASAALFCSNSAGQALAQVVINDGNYLNNCPGGTTPVKSICGDNMNCMNKK